MGTDRDAVEDAMLRAVGYVLVESNFMSQALQDFASSVADSPLVADLLAEATLGTQLSQVRRLVAAARARQLLPDDVSDRMDRVLRLLLQDGASSSLVSKRNAVAHGLWGVADNDERESTGLADEIGCDRLSHTGWTEIRTTVRSLHHVGHAFGLAEAALIHTSQDFELSSRPGKYDRDLVAAMVRLRYYDPARALTDLEDAVEAMSGGTADGWLWRTEKVSHRKEV